MEIFQNGNWSKTKEPIYQIREKVSGGGFVTIDSSLMTKQEAEAKLAAMQPKPKPKPKKKQVKKSK
jgi:hypothetical protein